MKKSFSSEQTFQTEYIDITNINSNIPFQQSQNEIIDYKKKQNLKQGKRVTFNNDIVIFPVESYKEHNKNNCYIECEDDDDINNNEQTNYYYKNYANQFNNLRNSIKKEDKNSKCCCTIL